MSKDKEDRAEENKKLRVLFNACENKIINNGYKDRGVTRGWQLKTPLRGVHDLHKDLDEFIEAIDQYQKPLSDNPYDKISEEEVINQGADVVCRVMFLLDQLGIYDVNQ